jgi:membrane protease YdiL (CAAX protease family)
MGKTASYPWLVFTLLSALGLLAGALMVWPYLLELVGISGSQLIPPTRRLGIFVQLAGSAALLVVFVGLGLLLAKQVGLGAPWLDSWLEGMTKTASPGKMLLQSVMVGVGGGVIGLSVIGFLAVPRISGYREQWQNADSTPAWQRLSLAFEAGVTEELIFRLFLLSLFVWMLTRFFPSQNLPPRSSFFWLANVGVALIFGLAHLPAKTFLSSPFEMAGVVFVNGVVSLAFGYLYWKQGVEAAMLAHFVADTIIHVFGHMIIR